MGFRAMQIVLNRERMALENAWSALRMVRLAIETTCPAGVLPSEEAVLGLYGPEPIHEGEALAKAIIETVERLTK